MKKKNQKKQVRGSRWVAGWQQDGSRMVAGYSQANADLFALIRANRVVSLMPLNCLIESDVTIYCDEKEVF